MAKAKVKRSRKKKRSFGDAFDSESRFYAGADIRKSFVATISEVKLEDLGDGEKWCLYLEDHDKGICLNKSNGRVLLEAFGDDPDEWEGEKVFVSTAKVRNPQTGKIGPGIVLSPVEDEEVEEADDVEEEVAGDEELD